MIRLVFREYIELILFFFTYWQMDFCFMLRSNKTPLVLSCTHSLKWVKMLTL